MSSSPISMTPTFFVKVTLLQSSDNCSPIEQYIMSIEKVTNSRRNKIVSYNFAIYTFRLVESYKSFCVRPPLEILQPFSEAATGGVSWKKAFLKHFVIFTGKRLCCGLFFSKVAGHQSSNLIKKILQHRYFLVNIGKFIITPNLESIYERLPFWKVFCKDIFQIRT